MKVDSVKAILNALNDAEVRYLVAGGVAVNIHGYQRLTHDLDLIIQLNEDNLRAGLNALDKLGYRPHIPVKIEEFADPGKRKEWIESKHMQVFSITSDEHRETTVDIFVTEPFDFDSEYSQARMVTLDQDLDVRIVSIPTLIDMKERAGRPRDKDDIRHLRWILEEIDKDDEQ